MHQDLIDLSIKHNLNQVQELPTRRGSVLDLVFTSNTSLVKSTSVVPGISDHDIVVVDSDTKPHHNPKKPKKCFLFGKADWDALRDKCDTMYTEIKRMYTSGSTVENLWSVFKTTLPNEVETHMPSKNKKEEI